MNLPTETPESTNPELAASAEDVAPSVWLGRTEYLDFGLVLMGLLVFGIAALPDANGSGLLTTIGFLAAIVLTGLAVLGVTQFLLASDRRSARVPPPPQAVDDMTTVVPVGVIAADDATPDPEVVPTDTARQPHEGSTAGIRTAANPLDGTGATEALPNVIPERTDSGSHAEARMQQVGKERSESSNQDQQIDAWLRQSRGRFELEIQKLAGRGRFNLALGVVIGGVGLALLAHFVLDLGDQLRATEEYRRTVANPEAGRQLTGEWQNNAILQGMRLSLSLCFGAFAFFFLRLYKSSLDLIKYYQNELTNLEGRFAALLVALKVNDLAVMNVVVDHLSRTERNFVLKQGETTVELELARHDGEKMRDILRLLSGSPLARRLRNAGRTNGGQG